MPTVEEIEADLLEELGPERYVHEMAIVMHEAGITREDNPDEFEELLAIYRSAEGDEGD